MKDRKCLLLTHTAKSQMPGGKNFLMIISYIYIAPFIPWDPKHFINSMQKSKKIHHGNVATICITLKISFSVETFLSIPKYCGYPVHKNKNKIRENIRLHSFETQNNISLYDLQITMHLCNGYIALIPFPLSISTSISSSYCHLWQKILSSVPFQNGNDP